MADPSHRHDTSGGEVAGGLEGQGETLLAIGGVVAWLRDEFPDLTISKIRYLEDRGLVSPERTPGGYRKYGQAAVRTLRTILTLQRDEFLPLDVIKERLERGTASAVGRPLAPSGPFDTPRGLKRDEPVYTWDQALSITGVSESFLRALAEFHLFDAATPVVETRLSEPDLEVVRICSLLSRHGVEPRNLRVLSSSAEREAALLAQVVAPSMRSANKDRREEGVRALADLGSLMARLLDLLLYRELSRLAD